MIIIGLSGTNGSGKDTVAKMLVERHNFLFVGATEMFLDELKKRGWPNDREHKAKLASEWRREFGTGVIVDKAYAQLKAAGDKYVGLIVGSLRNPGEADKVHELGGTMVWVDANPKVRYDRIQAHLAERAATHVEDNKTFDQFVAEEQREMTSSGDAATPNMSAVKDRADIVLTNDGNDISAFKDKAEQTLANILKN